MKSSFGLGVVMVACIAIPLLLAEQALMPRMTAVSPATGKAGDVVTVTGENLDKANLSEILMTDGKTDIPAAIVEQDATSLKFKIPAAAKPGRFSLVTRRAQGKEPREIEQPVKITVE
jgi:hypothetical protein